MESLKILAAVRPEHQGMLADVLSTHQVRFVFSFEAACEAVSSPLDMVLCALHFENGRVYDLLKVFKSQPSGSKPPFLCVQLTGSILPYGAFKSMAAALDLLGADLFVQVAKWRIEMGEEIAFAKLLDVISSLALQTRNLSPMDRKNYGI